MKFTKRESEIMDLTIEGKTTNQIANDLFISTRTVNSHIERLFKRYDVHKRSQLIILYMIHTLKAEV